MSAADLVRMEQLTSLRDRGTLSQSQFEMERDNILGAAEPISKAADARPAISPAPPPPPLPAPPAISSTAATNVQGTNGANVIFIAVVLLLLLIALVAFNGATQSSPDEAPAIGSDAVSEDPAVEKCSADVEKENWQSAFASCSTAATLGASDAQINLGFMYADGKGVTQDYAAAAFWFRMAAVEGDAIAQAVLGALYYDGLGVPKNSEGAAIWYGKAAEQGNDVAQYNLGLMHENGDGVNKDLVVAVSWLRKAADQGNADAKKRLAELGY